MKAKSTGFTIVELLIVIVVIAILAAISVVAYSGIQQRANNTARVAVGDQWIKAFKVYEAYSGSWPPSLQSAAVGAKFCLGTGFPVGGGSVRRCQNVTGTDANSPAESANATLMSELQSVSSIPTSTPIPAPLTGPYLEKTGSNAARVIIGLNGVVTVGADCGGGFISIWTDSSSTTGCQKSL